MYKTILLLALIPLVTSQCGEPFKLEDDVRIQVSGQVVDATGNPISGILVYSEVMENTLGSGFTNDEGKFNFTSLQSHDSGLVIHVNPDNYHYTSIYYIDKGGPRKKNTYTLGKLVLQKNAVLHFEIKKTSSVKDTLHWALAYPARNCKYSYENDILLYSSCHERNYSSGTESPGHENFNYDFETVMGGAPVIFEYQIDDQPEKTISIPITKQKQTYVFEY